MLITENKGYTLPVWVAAAAKASLNALLGNPFSNEQQLIVFNTDESLNVPVSSASVIEGVDMAMGIAFAYSGLPLDLTNNLEIWICTKFYDLSKKQIHNEDSWIEIIPGVGVGKYQDTEDLCISKFARDLLVNNLRSLVPKNKCLRVEIIFPKGTNIAARTSNQSFGIVEGLSLIGTQAKSQVSASPEQLEQTIQKLHLLCSQDRIPRPLVFVIGANGFDLALRLGLDRDSIVKIGNWVGPLLVCAAEQGVQELLIFGYHGKMVKLAGGIFHTHNHLADARIEIIVALAIKEGIKLEFIQSLLNSKSLEDAFLFLEGQAPELAKRLWLALASEIETRSLTYIHKYGSWPIQIGSALFDRSRQLRWVGSIGHKQLKSAGLKI
tara:strand:- start:284 stop:1426 length:1143 start_codon:yes stop_codon:yes gene_type:complete